MVSEALLRIDRENYWHAFTQMSDYEPLVIERAKGVWLYDHHGRKLLDGCSSLWCNIHGHCNPSIDAAVTKQLGQVAHVTSLGMSSPVVLELTQRLVQCTPSNLECVFYGSDGASAVEVALKMAFQYWRQCPQPQPKRDRFIAVGNAYHGDTLGSVSVGGVSRFHAMFAPLLFDVVRGTCPDSYRLPEGVTPEQACDYYLAAYRKLFEQQAERIAAVIIEPLIQGAAGMIMQPPGFLRGLRELADEFETLLIVDEIAVGTGRTGKMWACEWEDVQPDFLCCGKGLSGGYLPLAATITTRRIWDAFLGDYSESKSLFHGHSYGGNPLACAASVATLDLFEENNTLQHVGEMEQLLSSQLNVLLEHPNVGDVRYKGMIAAVELVSDKAHKIAFPWAERRGQAVCDAAMDRGVWLRPVGNVIVVMPPLCSETRHIEQITEAIQFGLQSSF